MTAACTCARLSGDPGSYPCPVHPEFGAATFAGTVVQSDSAATVRPKAVPPSDAVRRTFEFADRVYICWGCGSMQPSGDKDCPDCGGDLFTWAGFLGRSDRFRVGSGDLPAVFDR